MTANRYRSAILPASRTSPTALAKASLQPSTSPSPALQSLLGISQPRLVCVLPPQAVAPVPPHNVCPTPLSRPSIAMPMATRFASTRVSAGRSMRTQIIPTMEDPGIPLETTPVYQRTAPTADTRPMLFRSSLFPARTPRQLGLVSHQMQRSKLRRLAPLIRPVRICGARVPQSLHLARPVHLTSTCV